MIKLLPKPLLRPVLSGKGFKECRDEQYICPKPLKGLKEWSVDVFYDKMNILTYPNGLHIPFRACPELVSGGLGRYY